MNALKTLLKSLRQENIHHRRFVPELALRQALTSQIIGEALDDSEISQHNRAEVAARIIHSGRKIFSILALIDQAADVLKFIEADELEDVRLPFKIETLGREISIHEPQEFDERQWEFLAPTFIRGTLNRRFREQMILPFTIRTEEGKGAFGKVYRLQLQEDHQALDGSFPQEFVQKELDNADDHRKELENLSILNHLKHPNIVELLASYTHQDKHSLLFPRAEHGTLATLFKTPRQDTDFASDATFLTALARLASAIEHIHDFFDHKIDLSLIGCHHDLRPQNILVSGTTLILADFGLSKFKDLFQNSDTSFRLGIGDYLAPECEDLEANFEPRRIRRSSDVWSFGCILAEAVTYMTRGHKAIEQFWNERVVFVRAFKLHLFHNGQNTSSAVVTRWLSMLQQSSESSCVMLITIVRRMLSIDPAGRPKAAEVVSRLRLIALHEQAALIDGLFNRIKQGYDSIDAVIERMRFLAWSRAIGIEEIQRDPASVWHPSFNEDIQFESVHDCLLRIHQDLKQRLQPVQDASYSPLNLLNDHLFHLLGPERQESCRTFFRISVHHTDDTRLRWNGMNDRGLFLEREIRLSTSLKQMITLMENTHITDTSQTQIKSSAVFLDRNKIGEHNTAHLRDGRKTWQVLVEWRKYGRDSADESISRQLFARLNAIVKQLSVKKPESIRALHCRGYFHDESQHAFGILYEIPRQESSADSTSIQNTTLHQWIVETTDKSKYWPVLDDKFRLAYILAKSVLEFHLVGWLHKNLTASNIAFFYPPTASREERTREPYIIGFNHSRPDEPSAFTEGIVKSGVLGYQHPKYRRATRGYRPEYDYYSLGVLLMEVGFWRPIKEIVGFGKTYGEEHDQKLRDRIPQLKQYMGRSYCEAVIACLSDDFNSLRTDDGGRNNKEVFIDFEIKVISRLNNHMVH